MNSEVLPDQADLFRDAYRQFLIDQVASKKPSRHIVDALRAGLSAEEGDRISFEVEEALGLPALNPKLSN